MKAESKKSRTRSKAVRIRSHESEPLALPGLRGKVVIVTGGARNIGRAIALRFAQVGARIAIFDLDLAGARRVAKEASAFTHGALAFGVDLADLAQVKMAVKRVAHELGRIDILVNNAAKMDGPSFTADKITPAKWDAMQDVSLRGAFFCTQAAVPHMRRTAAGRIISISSVVFSTGLVGCADYIAAKGGLIGLTRSLAREYGKDNITVNAVAAGAVQTPQELQQATPAQVASVLGQQCLKSRVVPEDIAHAVLFLASDLSAKMTGQTLNVDGGWVMH